MMMIRLRAYDREEKRFLGFEEVKKARKNLDWLIEEMEHEE